MAEAKKYPPVIRARDVSRNNAAVRRELRRLLHRERDLADFHVRAWEEDGKNGHRIPCNVCQRMSAERDGILTAIRFFGGRRG